MSYIIKNFLNPGLKKKEILNSLGITRAEGKNKVLSDIFSLRKNIFLQVKETKFRMRKNYEKFIL